MHHISPGKAMAARKGIRRLALMNPSGRNAQVIMSGSRAEISLRRAGKRPRLPSKTLTFGPFLRNVYFASWMRGIFSIMSTRYYSWFAFTYRFPWVGSGQGWIVRASR
jgi:hypothetical protein